MQTNRNENKIFLRGRLAEEPGLSHVNHGVTYCRQPLSVRRLRSEERRVGKE